MGARLGWMFTHCNVLSERCGMCIGVGVCCQDGHALILMCYQGGCDGVIKDKKDK